MKLLSALQRPAWMHTATSLFPGYQYCWLVDPLDGTKEFIKRNGEFTVNIALIQVPQNLTRARVAARGA